MRHWLFKSEPDEFSFADLKRQPRRRAPWSGVRNYQARNFMRAMAAGDLGLFYHSSCPTPGVAGVIRVSRTAYPDATAWDAASPYHDPACSPANPRWEQVDVSWQSDFTTFVPLTALQQDAALRELLILRRGNRLSVTPVSAAEFARILALGSAAAS